MGLITKVSFAEQIAAINGALDNIKQEWDKTIYVDQANGSDSNPGTQDAPVQSLQEAIDRVPVGGQGGIFLTNDYTLESDLLIENKRIILFLEGVRLTTQWIDYNSMKKLYAFKIRSAEFEIFLKQLNQTGNIPKIIIPYTDGSLYLPYSGLLKVENCGKIKIHSLNQVNDDFIEIRRGYLISGSYWEVRRANIMVNMGFYYTGIIRVNNGAFLIGLSNDTAEITFGMSGVVIKDENDNEREFKDLIDGKIFDNDGRVINIITNIALT